MSDAGDTESWEFKGGTFTSTASWRECGGRKFTELGGVIENKNTSTYLRNVLPLSDEWTVYQGVANFNGQECTFTSSGITANVNKTIEVNGYKNIYLGGIIDTQGQTDTHYIECLVYREGYDAPSTRTLTLQKTEGYLYTYYDVFTFAENITKITFRFRIKESNKTVIFKTPIAVMLFDANDIALGDFFTGSKDYYSDYAKESTYSKEADYAKEVSKSSALYQSKADCADLPMNLIKSSDFSNLLDWIYPTITESIINNGVFTANKIVNDNGILYQNTEFEEQTGDYVYLSLKLKTSYSLDNDTYLEAIVYYNDETYNTLTAKTPIGTDENGFYLLEVYRAITKPVTHAIIRVRLKNLSSYENVNVQIKEPFMAVVSSSQFSDIYNGNCLYYQSKKATPFAKTAIRALIADNVDLEKLYAQITPLAGKKLLSLGDSTSFGKKWQPQLCKLTGMNFLSDAIFTEYADNVNIVIKHLDEEERTVVASNYPIGYGESAGIKNIATAIGGSAVRAVATVGTSGTEVDGSSAIVDGVSYNVGVAPGESLYERSKYVHLYQPDVIIVMGSQNDGTLAQGSALLGSMEDAPYQGGYILKSEYDLLRNEEKKKYSFYAMYKGMLLNLVKNNPKASIYCCGVMRCLRKQYTEAGEYDEQATIDYFYNTMLPAIKVKNAAIKEVTEYYGCKYIDLEGLSINPWNNTEWSSDTGDLLVHPNIERGNMMALSIFNQM